MRDMPIPPSISHNCEFESLGWAGFIDIRGIRSISPVFEEGDKLFITISYEEGKPVKLYAKTLEHANELAKHIFTHMNKYQELWGKYNYESQMYYHTKRRY
ncbi:hypothetical protein YZUL1_48 [Citrobacter phage YZU-L1]|uniref:Uncharacterized protein n=1 Tax=Salmonella phage vB STyj5-1 TaxID=2801510 RepID=A0A7U0J6A3_9CAUD|nr:hypothetical protein vBSTyj51_19 [Salmonella phage vB STyj5-1]WJZ69698.1 hypothetical protein YZUL1_48 [Citrobacter phage YZU-L1]